MLSARPLQMFQSVDRNAAEAMHTGGAPIIYNIQTTRPATTKRVLAASESIQKQPPPAAGAADRGRDQYAKNGFFGGETSPNYSLNNLQNAPA